MKTHINWLIIPTALVLSSFVNPTALAEELIQIAAKFQPDPLVVRGISGGAKSSNCGNITTAPNQVIQVKESLPYLHLSLQSAGQPTLLVEGPGGRFCVLGDAASGSQPEISGYWQAGRYSIYVGERSQEQHPYTLSISEKHR